MRQGLFLDLPDFPWRWLGSHGSRQQKVKGSARVLDDDHGELEPGIGACETFGSDAAPANTSCTLFSPQVRPNFSGSPSELANRFTDRTVDQLARQNRCLWKRKLATQRSVVCTT